MMPRLVLCDENPTSEALIMPIKTKILAVAWLVAVTLSLVFGI